MSHQAQSKQSFSICSGRQETQIIKGQRKWNDKTFLTVQIEGQKNNTNDKDRKNLSTEKHNQFCLH